jgi:hypothetical protein
MTSGVWDGRNGPITAGTSTIALTYTGTSATTFQGGTAAYNNILISPGSGILTLSGAFSYASMTMASAGGKLLNWTHSTTYTQTGTQFLQGTPDGAPIISPTVLNGGFETLGGGGADVFLNWTEGAAGTSTVNADTLSPYAGTYCCRFDIDATSDQALVSANGVATAGVLYKWTFYAKANSGTAVVQATSLGGASVTVTASYLPYTIYGVATGVNIGLSSTSANKSVYIDQVTLQVCNSPVLASTLAGTPFTLSKASGIVECDYLSLRDSAAGGGASWCAGFNSARLTGVTGWQFTGKITLGAKFGLTADGHRLGMPGAASMGLRLGLANSSYYLGMPPATLGARLGLTDQSYYLGMSPASLGLALGLSASGYLAGMATSASMGVRFGPVGFVGWVPQARPAGIYTASKQQAIYPCSKG